MDGIHYAASEDFLLKVDVLEVGKMGKCKVLKESDKGQIVTARWLCKPSLKLQLLWGVPVLQ